MNDFDMYQANALRTAGDDSLGVTTLGLVGEAGEVADIIKKHLGHGHALDDEALAHELGDVLWYIAVMAASLGYTMSDIARMNIDKLKLRYPQGFSTERSIYRGVEKITLEPTE